MKEENKNEAHPDKDVEKKDVPDEKKSPAAAAASKEDTRKAASSGKTSTASTTSTSSESKTDPDEEHSSVQLVELGRKEETKSHGTQFGTTAAGMKNDVGKKDETTAVATSTTADKANSSKTTSSVVSSTTSTKDENKADLASLDPDGLFADMKKLIQDTKNKIAEMKSEKTRIEEQSAKVQKELDAKLAAKQAELQAKTKESVDLQRKEGEKALKDGKALVDKMLKTSASSEKQEEENAIARTSTSSLERVSSSNGAAQELSPAASTSNSPTRPPVNKMKKSTTTNLKKRSTASFAQDHHKFVRDSVQDAEEEGVNEAANLARFAEMAKFPRGAAVQMSVKGSKLSLLSEKLKPKAVMAMLQKQQGEQAVAMHEVKAPDQRIVEDEHQPQPTSSAALLQEKANTNSMLEQELDLEKNMSQQEVASRLQKEVQTLLKEVENLREVEMTALLREDADTIEDNTHLHKSLALENQHHQQLQLRVPRAAGETAAQPAASTEPIAVYQLPIPVSGIAATRKSLKGFAVYAVHAKTGALHRFDLRLDVPLKLECPEPAPAVEE
ncbi:unnamed protein product [Amoebophrya sp. A120]|nr:unnamed protein product [Amoebophrya sp. A120]|eukprot:GSA120T00001260001.1